MKPKLSNPLTLLCIACVMFAAMLVASCGETAKQEEPKTDTIPAATTPEPTPPASPDTSTMKKDSLPKIDSTNAPRPDGKKT